MVIYNIPFYIFYELSLADDDWWTRTIHRKAALFITGMSLCIIFLEIRVISSHTHMYLLSLFVRNDVSTI